MNHSSFHDWILIGPVLRRCSAGSWNCCQVVCAIARLIIPWISCIAALLSVFQLSILPIPPSVLFSALERVVQMACLGLSIQLSFVLSIVSSHNDLTIHVSTHRQTLISSLIRAAPPWVNGSKHRPNILVAPWLHQVRIQDLVAIWTPGVSSTPGGRINPCKLCYFGGHFLPMSPQHPPEAWIPVPVPPSAALLLPRC